MHCSDLRHECSRFFFSSFYQRLGINSAGMRYMEQIPLVLFLYAKALYLDLDKGKTFLPREVSESLSMN